MRRVVRFYATAFGRPPRANLVFVRSGTAGNLDDIGVYTSVERVNKRFIRKHFEDDDGHRYKADEGSMLYRGTSVSAYNGSGTDHYTISGGDAGTEYQDLIEVCDVLNNTSLGSLRTELDEVFSIDRLVWQAAAGVALLNWDDLRAFSPQGHNYYIYEDRVNDRLHVLPRDWDLSWSTSTSDGLFQDFADSGIPMTNRGILGIPEIKDRYLAHLRTMTERIDWAEIQVDVQRHRAWSDTRVTTVHEQEIFSHTSYNVSHFRLTNDIPNRRAFLDNQSLLNRPSPLISGVAHSPASVTSDDTVWVSASIAQESGEGVSSVVLFSRDRGRYLPAAMFDDGAHNDGAAGDGVYGASIPAYAAGETVEYYIETSSNDTANGSTGAKRYEPVYAEHKPFAYEIGVGSIDSPVVINEFMADNDTTIQDPDGTGFPDWVELFNTGDSAVDLSGCFLTDDLSDTVNFEIPAGVTIGAGEHLLFWADNDPEQGPTHATFKLSRSGEEIGLYAPLALGNGVADSYVFGEQTSDVSEGRSCDGDDQWAFFDPANPGTTNGVCPSDCLADLAPPFEGVLNLQDVFAYLALFNAQDPSADLAEPLGTFNLQDVFAYLALFNAGCP